MPGCVVSKLGVSLGKAVRSSLANSTPHPSTKARGGCEPVRAMIRSQRMVSCPSRVSRTSSPARTSCGLVSRRTEIRPSASPSSSSLTLAPLARAKSARRLRIVTTLPCASSAARPSAFSIPASPEPITVMCSSTYSVGSSSWYWTCGRSPPGRRSKLGLPCVPIASTTASASTVEPSCKVSVNAPACPAMPVTSALVRTVTWRSATCRSQVSRITSRLPASKSRSLRSTRLLGVAMTCLPFWYL